MSECTPTEADREDAKSFLIGLSLDGTDETPQSLPAEGVDDIVAELAALFAKVRADERAKRPDREQFRQLVAQALEPTQVYGAEYSIGHPDEVADPLFDALALEPEAGEVYQYAEVEAAARAINPKAWEMFDRAVAADPENASNLSLVEHTLLAARAALEAAREVE